MTFWEQEPQPRIARAREEQFLLIETEPSFSIATNAHARNIYGSLAQELACAALNLRSIPIDGRCAICFDAEKHGRFFEIKSVHACGKLVLYAWRIEKERAFAEILDYVVVVHRARGARNASTWLSQIASFLEVYVIPANLVHTVAVTYPLQQLVKKSKDPRNGYCRKGYVNGYHNVPLKAFTPTQTATLTFNCFGRPWTATLRTYA